VRRALALLLIVTAAFVALAGPADAAWTKTSAVSGYATARAIGLPTSPAASATSYSVVHVTWAAPTGGSVVPTSYVVRRTAPTAATVCTVSGSTFACDDTGRSGSTTYTYTVEARIGTLWTSGQTAGVSATTPHGPTFVVTVSGTKTAGTPFTVSITATTDGTTTDTAYTGVHALTMTGPPNSRNGDAPTLPPSVTFASGVGTATITLFDATTATLNVTDGVRSGSTSITVQAAAAAALTFSSSSADCSSGSVVVGPNGVFTSKVTSVDAYGNDQTGFHLVTVSRAPAVGTLPTTFLLIFGANPESTGSFSYTLPAPPAPDVTVTASSGGLTSATCVVKD
jgi:hypothetical protein